jgi:phage shock protein PspC (stress-responsive transcriptional regulator)
MRAPVNQRTMVLVSGIMADMSNGNGAADGTGPSAPGTAGPGTTDSGTAGPGTGRPGTGADQGGHGPDADRRRLERKLNGRLLAGVCIGIADYFNVDATLIRVAFAVLLFFGGFGAVAYLLAWALIPEEGEPVSIAEKLVNKDS